MRDAIILGLLLLASCSTFTGEKGLSDTCTQTIEGESNLHFILAYHNLSENTNEYYYNETLSHLRSVAPFDAFDFNVYTIPIEQEQCWSSTPESRLRPVLECDWDALNENIQSCNLQNFKLIIVTGNPVQTSTVPTYYQQSLSVINELDFKRYVLLHEIGHLFGLQEEYDRLPVPIESPAREPRKPNCAANLTQAQEWWGAQIGNEDTGYYPGCAGNRNFFRPNNLTLMGNSPHDSDYGYVSEQYLRDALNCCYAQDRETQVCTTFFHENPKWRLCRE